MHVLIAGTTGSGKTTLAKHLAKKFGGCLVYDPLASIWPDSEVHADIDSFLESFHATRSRHVFIDESLEVARQWDTGTVATATRGRHYGHRCYYIAQRIPGLSTTLRAQCHTLFMFAVPRRDSENLALDWNDPALTQAHLLPQYNFLHKARFAPALQYRLERGF